MNHDYRRSRAVGSQLKLPSASNGQELPENSPLSSNPTRTPSVPQREGFGFQELTTPSKLAQKMIKLYDLGLARIGSI